MVLIMKKSKILLLTSIFALFLSISFNKSPLTTFATGDTGDITDTGSISTDVGGGEDTPQYGFTYEEIVEGDGSAVIRYYEGAQIAKVQENFRAPSGCVLSLEPDEIELNKVMDELYSNALFEDFSEYKFFEISAYRTINGTKMFADTIYDWNIDSGRFTLFTLEKIGSLVVYETDDKISDTTVSITVKYILNFSDSTGKEYTYYLFFEIEPYFVKKTEPGDILKLESLYYLINDERVEIFTTLNDNLFNPKYGFKTDGRVPIEGTEDYYENYLIQYIDLDNNIIIDTDNDYDNSGITLEEMPKQEMNIVAKLTFKQDGVEYIILSNELVISQKTNNLLVDGYNNRTSFGKNNDHKLKLEVNVPYEEITESWFYLEVEETHEEIVNHVLEPSEYWEMTKSSIFKSYTTCEPDFYEVIVNFKNSGNYTLTGQFRLNTKTIQYYDVLSFNITVTDEEINYTPLDQALTLNVDERIDLVAGANKINLEAVIANDILNGGEIPTFTWELSRLNVLDIETDYNKAIINPIGGGVVSINVTCTGQNFEPITKTIIVNVIDDIYSITTLAIPDEFHYSNQNITIGLNFDKYNNIVNFEPSWSVVDKNGNEIPFIDNHNLSITIENPLENDYTISVLFNGIEIDTQTIQVRDINVDAFIQQNIIWIAIVTVAFAGLIIFLKYLLEKRGSIVTKIENTNKKFASIDINSPNIVKQLGKIRLSILADIDFAKNLNMNALNEYEKTIQYLAKSLSEIKFLMKNKGKVEQQLYIESFERLAHNLARALETIKEIEEAKQNSLKNSYMANENNIVKIKEEKRSFFHKKKKDKNK